MSETVLRVVQALTVKKTFNYVLNFNDITALTNMGYTVFSNNEDWAASLKRMGYGINLNTMLDEFGLVECTITKEG